MPTTLSRAALLPLLLCASACLTEAVETGSANEATSEPPTVIIRTPAPDPIEEPGSPSPDPVTVPSLPSDRFAADELALSEFAWDAWRGWSKTYGNLAMPVHQTHRALAVLGQAASGETWERLAPILGPDLEATHASLAAIDAELAALPGVTMQRALWAQQGLIYDPEFLDTLSRHYDAGLRLVDFSRGAGAAISSWKDEVGAPGASEPVSGDLVWTSALSLSANWVSPFDPSLTTEAGFIDEAGNMFAVQMMTKTGEHEVARLEDGATLLRMPLEDGQLSFVAYLPAPDTLLSDLSENMTAERFARDLDQTSTEYLRVSMPRIEIEESRSIAQTLGAIGFAGLLDAGSFWAGASPSRGFSMGGVDVGVRFTIDEVGARFEDIDQAPPLFDPGEAGAELTFNRPFLFALRHDATRALLLIGQMRGF